MGRLERRLTRLERAAREELVAIPQEDSTVKRFPAGELRKAFLAALDRELGRADVPDHPLSAAARRSSEAAWRRSFYTLGERVRESPPEDLSEIINMPRSP